MKIALAYSSKEGLLGEFEKQPEGEASDDDYDLSCDMFAEGDTPETIEGVAAALRECGHEVFGVEADEAAAANLDRLRPDLVFNMAEGLIGDFRESYIPMLCERLGLPYTGSDPLTLAICLNKARAKEILSHHGIPNAPFRVFNPGAEIDLEGFGFPAIVKPIAEGSSKGIFDDSVVDSAEAAEIKIREVIAKYRQPVIIEEFLDGDEFTVAVWGNGDSFEVLPIVAINFEGLPDGARRIYSYEAKWIWDVPENPLEIFKCPAPLHAAQRQQVERLVKKTCEVLKIRDWCRIDVRMDSKGLAHVIELNPVPGILPNPEENSCFPKAARTAGHGYSEMLGRVVEIAAERNGLDRRAALSFERKKTVKIA